MKLEVRIPINPTTRYFRQVEYVWRSFVHAGGAAAQARFIISLGEDCDPFDPYERLPWAKEANIEWRWADRETFQRVKHFATNIDRFRYGSDADVVLFLDADTLLVRPIDDLLTSIVSQSLIAGVMAHVPPFRDLPVTWQQVFASLGYAMPIDRYEHTGWGTMLFDPVHRFAPLYYNFGAVFVPGSLVADLGVEFQRQLQFVFERAPIHMIYRSQLALSLAIYTLGYAHIALGFEYNYANLQWADRKFVREMTEIRILHYLSEEIVGPRAANFETEEALLRLMSREDLHGSNRIFRDTLRRISPIPALLAT